MKSIAPTRVKIHDPDIARPTLVEAWLHGVDEKTGDRLVVIDGEPGALRRVKPDRVFTALRPVAL